RLQPTIKPLRPFVPDPIQVAIDRARLWRFEMLQERVHRRHDIGVRVERATGKADVGRPLVAEPAHQILTAAENPDGKPAAKRLAIGDEIGPDAEILLRAANGETEPYEHFVEDQNDVLLGANGAQLLEPAGIDVFVEMGAARAVDQR